MRVTFLIYASRNFHAKTPYHENIKVYPLQVKNHVFYRIFHFFDILYLSLLLSITISLTKNCD